MKNYLIELKWAAILSVFILIWMVMEKLTGLHSTHIDKHAIVSGLIIIPNVILYTLAIREKREKFYSGVMSWKQGFITGLVVSLFLTVFSPISQVIISTVISPEYFPNAIEHAVNTGNLTRPEAEAYFNLPNYLVQIVIGTPIIGAVSSAIIAIFTKKQESNLSE